MGGREREREREEEEEEKKEKEEEQDSLLPKDKKMMMTRTAALKSERKRDGEIQ